MIKSIIKWVKKLFKPSPETMAGWAAEAIAAGVNRSEVETKEKIGKITSVGRKAAETAQQLTAMLEDGTIDNKESEELAKVMLPLFNLIERMI